MREQQRLSRKVLVVAQVDIEDDVLCAMMVHRGIVNVAVNARYLVAALRHIELHEGRQIDGIQLCGLDCKGG